jgi:predicted dehydrogenase
MTDGQARIGIVGAGWWATLNHIPVVQAHPDAVVAAVSRLGRSELGRLLQHFNIPYGTEDPAQMLREVELDGVIVASPHVRHAEHALLALQAGKHVLVEKPAATSTADARRLQQQARARGVGLIVPHAWNYKGYAAMARSMVAARRIGQIRHVVCQMASPLTDLFAGQPMVDTADHFFRPPPSTWATPGQAGGYGWGQLTHALGLLAYVTSELAPREVTAVAGLSPAQVDYYDSALVRFAGGATGIVSGSATVPKGCPFQLDLRLFGSEGMLLLDVERERLALRRHDGEDETVAIPTGDGVPDGAQPVHRFIELCLGRLSPVDARQWGPVTDIEILDAMYRSIASGQPEKV